MLVCDDFDDFDKYIIAILKLLVHEKDLDNIGRKLVKLCENETI